MYDNNNNNVMILLRGGFTLTLKVFNFIINVFYLKCVSTFEGGVFRAFYSTVSMPDK